jgi:hypothetical protein
MPKLLNQIPKINLPFYATWAFSVQGTLRMDERHFMPIGDHERAPGNAIPIINQLSVYEPQNQQFESYRLTFSGTDINANNGYYYYNDRIVNDLPSALEVPDFDITPTIVNDNRIVAFNSTGNFDRIILTRINQDITPHLLWRAYLPGGQTNIVHRLPTLPDQLNGLSSNLRNYNFSDIVRVRAERFDNLDGFEEVQDAHYRANDPLWIPKAGYLAVERAF